MVYIIVYWAPVFWAALPWRAVCLSINISATVSSPSLKIFLPEQNCRNIIPDTGLFPLNCWKNWILLTIPMTLFLIMKCLFRSCGREYALQKWPVPQNILKRLPVSISSAVVNMVWGACVFLFSTGSAAWGYGKIKDYLLQVKIFS